VLDACTIYNSTANDLYIDLPYTEQATTPCRCSESSEGELLYSKLPLNCIKVAFPLEFIVNLDAKELSLLDRYYNLLIKVN
jgi:hypothetical protein